MKRKFVLEVVLVIDEKISASDWLESLLGDYREGRTVGWYIMGIEDYKVDFLPEEEVK